ncbi:MAG: hypothetical protein VW338_04775 [Rhodospirillaceae bacterium]
MIDYAAALLDPVYDALAIDATLTLAPGSPPLTVQAIDKTGGMAVGDGVSLETVRPVAAVRMAELDALGVSRAALAGAVLAINGNDWHVKDVMQKPAPAGEHVGEFYLILMDEDG